MPEDFIVYYVAIKKGDQNKSPFWYFDGLMSTAISYSSIVLIFDILCNN